MRSGVGRLGHFQRVQTGRSIVNSGPPIPEADDALGRITQLLAAAGEANPLDALMPLVHQDLRRPGARPTPADGLR